MTRATAAVATAVLLLLIVVSPAVTSSSSKVEDIATGVHYTEEGCAACSESGRGISGHARNCKADSAARDHSRILLASTHTNPEYSVRSGLRHSHLTRPRRE